jgi:apolipoprotein N-acyltransferase
VTIRVDRFGGITVFLAGALAVTAFAPFGGYPLVILSLGVLFNQWLADNPRRALRHGFLFGLGFFGAGISWVYVSIHEYGHVPVAGAFMVAAGLVVFLSLYPALLGYSLKRSRPEPGWLVLVMVFPAGWIVAEWVRGWLFSGFPWLTVGSSQIDSPLAGYAPVLGIFGTGLAVASSAALLVAVLRNRKRLISLLVLGVIWAGGYLLDRMEWTEPRGAALKVALVQGNIAQDEKWAPDNLLNTLTRYTELTFELQDIDLVVWPETAIPSFYHQVKEDFIPRLETALRAKGTTLLTGIPVLDKTTWDYYNSVISLGGEPGFYHKQHLVPYGEYLPLRKLMGHTLDALAVPEQIIKDLPEAALLVNVSNDAWFGKSLAPHQHLEMARMRAKETGRPLLRATNTGISAIIDHGGQITARSSQFEEAVITGSVIPRQGATPYVLLGNTPVIVFTLACLLFSWIAGRVR